MMGFLEWVLNHWVMALFQMIVIFFLVRIFVIPRIKLKWLTDVEIYIGKRFERKEDGGKRYILQKVGGEYILINIYLSADGSLTANLVYENDRGEEIIFPQNLILERDGQGAVCSLFYFQWDEAVSGIVKVNANVRLAYKKAHEMKRSQKN